MTGGRHPSLATQIPHKVVALNAISSLGLVFILILGMVAFAQDDPRLGTADMIAAGVVALNMLYLRRTGNYGAASHVGTAFVGVFFLYLFLSGGVAGTASLWAAPFTLCCPSERS